MFDTQQITSAANRSKVEAGLPCSTLSKSGNPCIALAGNTISREPHSGGNGNGFDATGSSYTLTKNDVHAVALPTQVRRLTPTECARLQGFPDDYLPQVPGYSDSAAYKALGNSMAVNCMQLIGQRIQMVNEIPQAQEAAA